MAYKYQKSSTDLNQPEIVKELRKAGVIVFNVTCTKEFCDLVTCYNGVVMLLEVKDGSKPASQRKLTPRELKAVKMVNSVGCQIHVVNSIDEALALVIG